MRRAVVALAVLAVAGVMVVLAPPALAGITSISPSSGEVPPGGSRTATVNVSTAGVTCLSVTAQGPGVSGSISGDPCGSDNFSKTLNVSSSGDTPPGEYRITVIESAENTSATFRLTVRAPATTTSTTAASTTTSTVADTTTTSAATETTTTVADTTTTSSTTSTTAPSTTTTAPGTPAPFTSVNELATTRPMPDEVVFLPLSGSGYENCIPLRAACTDPEFALVLLPPSQYDIAWEATEATTRVEIQGVQPLVPPGKPPADPATASFLLPVLDLSQPGGQLRSLPRAFDGAQLVAGESASGELVLPVPSGPSLEKAPKPFLTSNPFNPPVLADAEDFTDQSPAVVAFSATRLQVLFGLRPLGSWGANQDYIPVHGTGIVPRLVQRADGTTGLAVPVPDGLRLPRRRAESTATVEEEDGGSFPIAPVLFGVSTLVVIALLFLLIRGRRSRELGEAEDDDW